MSALSTPLTFFLLFGPVILGLGVIQFIREPRRLHSMGLVLVGAGLTVLSGLVFMVVQEWLSPLPVILMVLLLMVPGLGYPILTVFLLFNGVTMFRRESRSLGNLLSLLVGIGLLLWPLFPGMLRALNVPYDLLMTLTGVANGLIIYFGAFFLIFLCSSVAYRFIRPKGPIGHVIVLGSGLVGDRVPPLLASRIDRAIELADAQSPPAVLIPSGGQGHDEDLAEGVAMARYMEGKGVDRQRILIEDKAVNTEENLLLSLKLIDEPSPNVLVVTSDYHVFRAALLTRALEIPATVRGAKTAFYFVPSSFIREFIAVCRQNLKFVMIVPVLWILLMIALAVASLLVG